MKKILLILTGALLFFSCTKKSEQELFISDLMNKMTLQEKIGQLVLFSSDWDVTGPTIKGNYEKDIREGKCGAIFNAFTADYTRKLQQVAVEKTRLGIPLIFGYDVIHGHRTIFPISLGESASWDLKAMEESARVAAIEASAEGIQWTFAPMVDIARDPRWGRVSEGAGEDTYLGCQIAKARVKGFQGDDLSKNNTILACAKHFAAYGAAQAGRDYNTVDISERVLRETYLPPFKACVDEGAATFMTSFNELDGVPSSGNKYLLKDILRDEWKFDGFVVTDYTSINEMVKHGISKDDYDAGKLAINSGVDMDMQGTIYYNYLEKMVKNNDVSEATIDNACRNILNLKYKLGLFEDPYRYCDAEREKKVVMCDEHIAKAREVAGKSIVLLKNAKSTLPVVDKTKRIAVIGALATSKEDMIGSWSAAGDGKKSVTLLEGLKKQYLQHRITYAKGCEVSGNDKSGFAKAIRTARNSDVIILTLGESKWMSGEAASRSNINLPGVQSDLLVELKKLHKPIVLVLMNGRPLAIEKEVSMSDAVLETWYLGTTAGDAIADVIFGKVNPSAKLPITFPRNLGQVPIFYNCKNTGRPFDKNNKYTSKYLDVDNTPLFPFGYGLSYSSFEYFNLKLSEYKMNEGGTIKASVSIKNTSKYDGTEIVQLYIQDLVGSVTRPLKELKAFKKVFIPKGETKHITFDISTDDLKFYRRDMTFGTEKGEFKVFIGTNSSNTLEAKFTLQ